MTKQKPDFELKATQDRIDEVYTGLALRLNEVIEERGLLERSLASVARDIGVNEAKLKGVMTNSRDIPLADIITIAKKLDVSIDYLLFGVGEKKKEKLYSPAVFGPSVYDSLLIDKTKMIDLLINTILPKLDDEEREAVMTHVRLLIK